VTARYAGSLAADEIEAMRSQLKDVVSSHGRVRLLMEYGDVDIGRIEPKAMWEDLKNTDLMPYIDKVAVVADQGWLQKAASLADLFPGVSVEAFGLGRRDEALSWVQR
jgi:hypothetical protein